MYMCYLFALQNRTLRLNRLLFYVKASPPFDKEMIFHKKSGKPIQNIISGKIKGDIFGKMSPFVYVILNYQKTFKTSSSVLRFTFVGSVAG